MNTMMTIISKKIWLDSAKFGLVLIGVISSLATIAGQSLDNVSKDLNWISRALTIITLYAIIVIITALIYAYRSRAGVTMKIRGITVSITRGDIFTAQGWKVIPFNEYFDTQVDDVVIAKNTLNGILITKHIQDIGDFNAALSANDNSPLNKEINTKNNKLRHQLGYIKTYRDYMLLSFTHFNDQNEAHISQGEYEDCLRSMWKEICRTYANKPIFLPLLGSGITRFDDNPHKTKSSLLKCILCTLRRTGHNINQPITILLSDDAMSEINLYEMKGEGDNAI